MTKSQVDETIRTRFFDLVVEKFGRDKAVIDSDGGGRWQIYIEGFEQFELSGTNNYFYISTWGTMKGKPYIEEHSVLLKKLQDLLEKVVIELNKEMFPEKEKIEMNDDIMLQLFGSEKSKGL